MGYGERNGAKFRACCAGKQRRVYCVLAATCVKCCWLDALKWLGNITEVRVRADSDVRLTVRRNSVWIGKTNWMSLFVFFISLLIVAQHVSGQPCAHHQELTTA